MWSGRCEANLVWQMWFGKCGLANVVWQMWFDKHSLANVVRVVGGGGSVVGSWGVSMSLMSSISQVYGFLDLWS